MKTPKEIKEFLNNKVLANINFTAKDIISDNTPKVETILIDDFLEWFENKPKEGNQDTITFKGKEYEFVEYDSGQCDSGQCCYKCDIGSPNNCTLESSLCESYVRLDKREGYFKLKEQELKLIPNEFYYLKRDNYSWVIQFKGFEDDDVDSICYYYMLQNHNNSLNYEFSCNNNGWVKATSEQKLLLIDKVEKETDKVWNEDTKMFEDKPKEILVPESIKIIKYQNDQLGLVFNDNKQVLTFSKGVFLVLPLLLDKFTPCKLIETRFEELHEGDIFLEGLIKQNPNTLGFYNIKIGSGRWIYIDTDDNPIPDNYSIMSDSYHHEEEKIIYKVVPLN